VSLGTYFFEIFIGVLAITFGLFIDLVLGFVTLVLGFETFFLTLAVFGIV
jgi:hypothetical protein